MMKKKTIIDLQQCDFNKIALHLMKKKQTVQEKLKKVEREDKMEQYRLCIADGEVEEAAGVAVTPPGLMLHSKSDYTKGRIRPRIQPEDITINCSKKGDIPQPPYGRWKAVIEKQEVAWLAHCSVPFGINMYMTLHVSAHLSQLVEMEKYNKVNEMHNIIGEVRAKYFKDLESAGMTIRQLGVIMYLIDHFALRAGRYASREFTGSCTLKKKHIRLLSDNKTIISFDAKQGIPYFKEVEVPHAIYTS